MNLTLRQQRALESICETFLPPADGWPSALELGIPEAIAAAMDFNPRPKDRAQLLQLLDLWDSSLHGLFTIVNDKKGIANAPFFKGFLDQEDVIFSIFSQQYRRKVIHLQKHTPVIVLRSIPTYNGVNTLL